MGIKFSGSRLSVVFALFAVIAGFQLCFADNVVSYKGIDYQLNDSVILIDREGIFKNESASANAAEALRGLSAGGYDKATVLVAPSVYWLDDPDDPAVRSNPGNKGTPFALEIHCGSLEIIGLSDNPEDVVFAVNRGQTQGAVGNYTMLHFFGKEISVRNITLGNYCNVDLDYPRNRELNRSRRKDAIVQAQIGICEGTDRLFADNCRFISRLNLCPLVGGRRSLYKDCYFECTDDALSGSAVYLGCSFTFFSSKPFYSTAETGAVFLDCDIHCKTSGNQYFTKVPGMVAAIDTRFTSENPLTLRWTRDNSPIRSYQSNITLDCLPVKIDQDREWLSADLTGSSALDAFKVKKQNGKTLYNIPNLLAGDDGWDPLGMLPEIIEEERNSGRKLTGLPVALRLSADKKRLEAKRDTATIIIEPLAWGGYTAAPLNDGLRWKSDNGLSLMQDGDLVKAISRNGMPEDIKATVSLETDSRLAGALSMEVGAYLHDAPDFREEPVVSFDKKQKALNVAYTVKGSSADDSEIIWYRSHGIYGNDTVAVRHGRGPEGRTYPLTKADEGCMISVKVCPKRIDSRQGESRSATYNKIISRGNIKKSDSGKSLLETTFREIPVRRRQPGTRGVWCFDTFKPADTSMHDWKADENTPGWYYGNGFDAAAGNIGLSQMTKGARISYIPAEEKCGNMEINLTAFPCKGGGQGFGSATKQYMDVCLKFNPVSLDGYALRIERTPEYDSAVVFSLVKYEKGEVTVISEKTASDCYRKACHINVRIADGKMTATASTNAAPTGRINSEIKNNVALAADVEMTELAGMCLQHTGSWGASATVIGNMSLLWE